MHKLALGVVVIAFLVVGCSKKKGDGDHLGTWKKADTQAALQGAWVGPGLGNSLNKAAWEVTGDTIKVFDGKAEATYKLEMEAPCKLGLKGADGTTTYFAIVMKDGKPLFSGGNAGQRAGDHAVMCAGLQIWSVEKGKCHEKSLSGRWEENTKCGFRKNAAGKEEFFWTWMDKQEAAEMEGDYLMPSKDGLATKVADYAAAKAALPPKE